jgi:hypothetical protein
MSVVGKPKNPNVKNAAVLVVLHIGSEKNKYTKNQTQCRRQNGNR